MSQWINPFPAIAETPGNENSQSSNQIEFQLVLSSGLAQVGTTNINPKFTLEIERLPTNSKAFSIKLTGSEIQFGATLELDEANSLKAILHLEYDTYQNDFAFAVADAILQGILRSLDIKIPTTGFKWTESPYQVLETTVSLTTVGANHNQNLNDFFEKNHVLSLTTQFFISNSNLIGNWLGGHSRLRIEAGVMPQWSGLADQLTVVKAAEFEAHAFFPTVPFSPGIGIDVKAFSLSGSEQVNDFQGGFFLRIHF